TKLMTSSAGRLFDAVSAMAGICRVNSYEGEAAILLEAACSRQDSASAELVALPLERAGFPWVIDTRPLVREIARKSTSGHAISSIADTFHSSIAHMIKAICVRLHEVTGIAKVCFSGGTFQNCT